MAARFEALTKSVFEVWTQHKLLGGGVAICNQLLSFPLMAEIINPM
jgi:hypothetical protein